MSTESTWTRRQFNRIGGLFTISLAVSGMRGEARADTMMVECQLKAEVIEKGFQIMIALRNITSEVLSISTREGEAKVQSLAVTLSVNEAKWDVMSRATTPGPVSRAIRYIETPLPPDELVTIDSFSFDWPSACTADAAQFANAQATVSADFGVQLRVPTSRSPVHNALPSQEAELVLPPEAMLTL